MIKTGSLYYASDKALHDALCQKKMKNNSLADLFLLRGIIVSSKTDKNEAAKHFSRLTHDYFDYLFITDELSSGTRREKSTTTRLEGIISMDVLEKVASKIIKSEEESDSIVTVLGRKNGIDIEIKYKNVDFNKPEFRQIEKRTAKISFDIDDSGMNIRSPANVYIEKVKETCIDNIYNEFKDIDPPKIAKITLKGYDSKVKTKFFQLLIKTVGDYQLEDVTDVWVAHPKTTEKEDESGIHIKKASLVGEGVFKSAELKAFFDRGFYLSKVIWTAKKGNPEADLYTFESLFLDPDVCDSYAYQVKGVNKYSKARLKTVEDRALVSQVENDRLSRLLEAASRKALKATIKNLGQSDD